MRIDRGRRLVGLALALAAACVRPPRPTEVVDLVADGALGTSRGPASSTFALCADESWTAVPMRGGDRLGAELPVGDAASLVLEGCVEDAGPVRGRLLLRLVPEAATASVPLGNAGAWWRESVGLGACEGRRTRIELELDAPPETALYLREVRLERPSERPRRPPHAPRILLVSIDTLRADAVGGPDTPGWNRLAAAGETWSRHWAASHWTKPSHASLLTGQPPRVHGATDELSPIAPGLTTLAERLSGEGFATGAIVYDCGWLKPELGFARGFDDYLVRRWRMGRAVDAAVGWMDAHHDGPFFFFLHTFEPHSDGRILSYEAPGLSRTTVAARFGRDDLCCRANRCGDSLLTALSRGELDLRPGDPEAFRALYDESVRYADAMLGRLMDRLSELRLWEDLLVVVTSDHGEEFWEHRNFGHVTAYEQILRVPMVVKWPRARRAGEVDDTPSTSIDLMPTLLATLGLDQRDLPGVPLGRRGRRDPLVFGTAGVAVAGDLKAIVHGVSGEGGLFDLAADPGEHRDLGAERPEALAAAAALIARHRQGEDRARAAVLAGRPAPAPVPFSEEELRLLRSIGYLQEGGGG